MKQDIIRQAFILNTIEVCLMNLIKLNFPILLALILFQGCGTKTLVNHLADVESGGGAAVAEPQAEPVFTTIQEPVACPETPPAQEPAVCAPSFYKETQIVEKQLEAPYAPPANALEVTSRGSGLADQYITEFKHRAQMLDLNISYNHDHWYSAVKTVKKERLPYSTTDALAYYFFYLKNTHAYFATQNYVSNRDLKKLSKAYASQFEKEYLENIGHCTYCITINLLPETKHNKDWKHNISMMARRLLLKQFAATHPNHVLSKSVQIVRECENQSAAPFFFDDHLMEWTHCRKPLVKYLKSSSASDEEFNQKERLLEFLSKY